MFNTEDSKGYSTPQESVGRRDTENRQATKIASQLREENDAGAQIARQFSCHCSLALTAR